MPGGMLCVSSGVDRYCAVRRPLPLERYSLPLPLDRYSLPLPLLLPLLEPSSELPPSSLAICCWFFLSYYNSERISV